MSGKPAVSYFQIRGLQTSHHKLPRMPCSRVADLSDSQLRVKTFSPKSNNQIPVEKLYYDVSFQFALKYVASNVIS